MIKEKDIQNEQFALSTEILNSQSSSEREECLFSLTLNGNTVFGISVKEGEEASICTVQCQEDNARRLFSIVSEYKASPIQLSEITEDFIKENFLF